MFGVKGYRLDADTDKFAVSTTSKQDGFFDVRLLLKERLDRETQEEYKLR